MNVRVVLQEPIRDGMEVIFRAPCDASAVTGLNVYYPANGVVESKTFAFADANANDIGHLDFLFAEGAVVKVILDLDTNMAFVQNADTNAYLEGRFTKLKGMIGTGGSGGGGIFLGSGDMPEGYNIQIDPNGEPFELNAVTYTPQTLTPKQQAQARENIGADVLRVTLIERLDDNHYTCSHRADKIHEAVQSGKTVILDDISSGESMIYTLSYSDTISARFVYFNVEDERANIYIVDNKNTAYYEYRDIVTFSDGYLRANTPTEDDQVANKAYVDNAVKGKSYELIETITLEEKSTITRSQEPDGTPYNFKQMYLALKTNAQGTSGWLLFKNGATTIGGYYMGGGKADATSYNAVEIRLDTGFWRTTWSDWGTNNLVINTQAYANERDYYPIKGVDEYPAITSVILQAELTAGTEIQIWGVRVDA